MATSFLIGGGIVILILLGTGVYVTVTSERSLVEERIGKFLDETAYQEMEFGTSEDDTQGDQPSFLTNLFDNLVKKSSHGGRIASMLAKADLKFRPGEYVALVVIATISMAGLGFFFGGGRQQIGGALVFTMVGAVVGMFLPKMYVGRMQTVRLKKFSDQLPDMLNLMVNGLRAGYSTMQALEAVSKELPAPISSEFRRVVQEMQLGVPMEKAFDNLLNRIPSEDLDLVITAVNVQREVGGNLAEILETISHTIRERIRIKGEIKTLTAQVVYSGRFLSLMPIFIVMILYAINRDYIMQFFIEPGRLCGIGLLVCGGIMIIIGYFVMNKIADIEV